MSKAERWLYAVGAVIVVGGGLLVLGWHDYSARREIAKELAGDLSAKRKNGEAYLLWYPANSSTPLQDRELHYCGMGVLRMASRGTTEGLDCAETASACLADVDAKLTACRRVEVTTIREGQLEAGSPEEPRCGGGFFSARVCAARAHVEDEAPVVFSVTVR